MSSSSIRVVVFCLETSVPSLGLAVRRIVVFRISASIPASDKSDNCRNFPRLNKERSCRSSTLAASSSPDASAGMPQLVAARVIVVAVVVAAVGVVAAVDEEVEVAEA